MKQHNEINLSKNDIVHIAHLARIELRHSDCEKFQHQLTHILGYINKLQELDTDGVEPHFYMGLFKNVTREDKPIEAFTQDEAFVNAPSVESHCFKAPRILEQPGKNS